MAYHCELKQKMPSSPISKEPKYYLQDLNTIKFTVK